MIEDRFASLEIQAVDPEIGLALLIIPGRHSLKL
jgi:hypothetical protein